jgi:hypothetical protein
MNNQCSDGKIVHFYYSWLLLPPSPSQLLLMYVEMLQKTSILLLYFVIYWYTFIIHVNGGNGITGFYAG